MNSKHNLITILDIGTTKIVCLAAINDANIIRIIGSGTQLADGFKNGVITDLKQAEDSIISAVESAEKSAKHSLNKVVVSISGNNISSNFTQAELYLTNHPINERDIAKVINLALEQFDSTNSDIIHYFPVNYSIDKQEDIKDPIAMYGNLLSCRLHIISAPSNFILNLANCLARCQLDIEDFIITNYASAIACITKDEQKAGCLIIDLGGSITHFSLYENDQFIYADSINIGGVHITQDITQCFSIDMSQAERIKIIHGNIMTSSFDEHKVIELNNDDEYFAGEYVTIKLSELTEVVKSRAEEILEIIREILSNTGYLPLVKRIVLTGGGSQLIGIRELVVQIFNVRVRAANPKLFSGLPIEYQGPAMASALGMIKIVSDNLNILDVINEHKEGKIRLFFKQFFKWI